MSQVRRDGASPTTVLAGMLRRAMGRMRSAAVLREFIRTMSAVHLFAYRATNGWVGGRLGLRHARMLLLTTRGRKTGKQWTVPLLSLDEGDNSIIIASHGGLDQPPAWWLNLQADPHALIQVGSRTIRVRAEQADPETWRRLWPLFVRAYPGYEDYKNRTSRQIPIIILRPAHDADGHPS